MTVLLPCVWMRQSTADDGPPASRTAKPNAVEGGADAVTTAMPSDDCASPRQRISCCSLVDPRGMTTVATRNVTVEGSAPPMLLNVVTPWSTPPRRPRSRDTPTRRAGCSPDYSPCSTTDSPGRVASLPDAGTRSRPVRGWFSIPATALSTLPGD